MSDNAVRRQKGMAMGQGNIGYGHMGAPTGGRNPGFAKGGHVARKVPTARHSNMHGGIDGEHDHTHKSHGHGYGVQHQETGGVGEGGTVGGPKQDAHKGPSCNQFGESMPKGGTIGRW